MARKCKCKATGEEGNSDIFIKIDKYYYKSQKIYDEYQKKLSQIKSGVYKITNIDNNKVYIGESINIYRRWEEHVNDLKSNKHANYLLQNDFNNNKFASDSFKFEILQEHKANNIISTKCQLLMLEYEYIRKFENENYKLYNLEYSLLKALNGDRLIFNLENFDSLKARSILASQLIKFKFNLNNNIFELSERNTPIVIFSKLGGFKSCSKSNKKYKEFINILNTDYKNDLGKIIKKYKFKCKLKKSHEKSVEEVTEYGMQVFEKILKENQHLINQNIVKNITNKEQECSKKGSDNNHVIVARDTNQQSDLVPISKFITEIRNKLELDIDTYHNIRNWLCELGYIYISKNHMYITDISDNNNFLIKKSKCYDKVNKVDYFTIATTKIFREHINNLIDNMSNFDKIKNFHNSSIELDGLTSIRIINK